jgi:hypothetical protein
MRPFVEARTMANSSSKDEAVIADVASHYARLIGYELDKMNINEIRRLVSEIEIVEATDPWPSHSARRQIAQILRQARRLPVGSDRNELRQIAIALIWLNQHGVALNPITPVPADGDRSALKQPPRHVTSRSCSEEDVSYCASFPPTAHQWHAHRPG